MSWTCGSCGHVQGAAGKCASCKDTNLIEERGIIDPLLLAKARKDILKVQLHLEVFPDRTVPYWRAMDALGQVVAIKAKLHGQDGLEYLLRENCLEYRMEICF